MGVVTRIVSFLVVSVVCLGQANLYFGRGIWRGREVDFRIVDGWAVVEGDIVAGRAADLTARYQAWLQGPGEVKERLPESIVTGDQARLWPKGIIPYEIDSVLKSTADIEAAIRHWNDRTAIRLIPRDGELNYLRFTPWQDPSTCASSSVGISGGVQYIYGTENCPATILIHEIGHAAGLFHEQSRSDRDRYVRILWENMAKPGRTQFGASGASTDLGPYDYYSIMHYRVGDFGRNGQPGMETIPAGIPIGQDVFLSDGDIDAIAHLYDKAPQSITISTTPAGRTVLVDGEPVVAPKSFGWAPGETHTLEVAAVQADDLGRYEFASWSDGSDRIHTITVKAEDTLYIANFVRYNKFAFRAEPEGAGTVTLSPASGDGYYRDGILVTATAVPAPGYTLAGWAGPFVERNNLVNYNANPLGFFAAGEFQGLIARFAQVPTPGGGSGNRPVTRFVTALASGGSTTAEIRVDGKAYRTPAAFTWDPGSPHDVEVPDSYPNGTDQSLRTFQKWNDGADRTRKVTAPDAPTTFTATYGVKYYFGYGWNTGGNLTVSPPSSDQYYELGSNVTVTATASAPAQFVGWGQDLWGRQNPFTFPMAETTTGFGFFLPPGVVSAVGIADPGRGRANVALSGRSLVGTIAPGELVTIYSPDFGPDDKTDATPDDRGLLPATLAGVRALFGGVPGPLVSVAKGQVAALVPFGIARLNIATVALEYNGARTSAGAMAVAPSYASIYTADGSGRGQAKVLNESGTANGPDNPAEKRSTVTFFAGGLGATVPAATDGRVSTGLGPTPAGKLEVRIGGAVARLIAAGLAPGQAGVYQLQVEVPESARTGSATPLIVTVDGAPSQFDVTMAVK